MKRSDSREEVLLLDTAEVEVLNVKLKRSLEKEPA